MIGEGSERTMQQMILTTESNLYSFLEREWCFSNKQNGKCQCFNNGKMDENWCFSNGEKNVVVNGRNRENAAEKQWGA